MEVSPSLISGYETGERTPSAEMLLGLAGLYSCGTDYLLGIKAAAPGASVLSGLTAAQVSIIRAIADEFRKTNG